ncbi:uncharacterized protein LOC144908054 [Branchiostoma floridae x Branchiostoma belcheri]
MEKEPRRHGQSRRCSVCRLPVKGHPGPCGQGKCQYERGKGASDSDAYFSRLKDTVRHLRKESKVDEIARRVWSESTSDESEDVLMPRPRSLPVKTADLSPGRVDGNQARHARAYSEPPEVPRLKSAFTSGQESPATSKKDSDSEQYTVRDLRASKKLVREVDQVLEGLLEPTSRARGKIAEKRGNHRSSSTSSCGSNSSSEEDRPHRARSTRPRRSRERRRHRKRSISRENRHRKRSNSRDKRHRKRSDSREKRHRKRSDSRDKRHRKRSNSRETRHRKRSNSRDKRHSKRSDNRGRSTAASSRKRGERSRKNRSRRNAAQKAEQQQRQAA